MRDHRELGRRRHGANADHHPSFSQYSNFMEVKHRSRRASALARDKQGRVIELNHLTRKNELMALKRMSVSDVERLRRMSAAGSGA